MDMIWPKTELDARRVSVRIEKSLLDRLDALKPSYCNRQEAVNSVLREALRQLELRKEKGAGKAVKGDAK